MDDIGPGDVALLRRVQYGTLRTISVAARGSSERDQIIRLQSRRLVSVRPVTLYAADVELTEAGRTFLAGQP